MALLISACTSEGENLIEELPQINYEKLNSEIIENLTSFSKMIEYDEALSNDVDKFLETGDETIFLKKPLRTTKTSRLTTNSIVEKVSYSKEDLSEVYSENQKEFLVDFYNELANNEDGYILDVVLNYKDLLKQRNLSEAEFNQINSILVVSEQSILILDGVVKPDDESYTSQATDIYEKSSFSSKSKGDGFWDCMRLKAGKAIGRGLVEGAIVGAIGGAKAGAGGGTVALPVIGTITGAVGGAVFGAAGGAVGGAVVGAIWTAVDCGAGSAFKRWLTTELREKDEN